MSSTSANESAKNTVNSIVATLAGLGTTWAAYGLKLGQLALEQSAGALGKTAATLETLASELDKKAAPPASPAAATDATNAPAA